MTDAVQPSVVVVVGNPRSGSRTRDAAERLAEALTCGSGGGSAGSAGGSVPGAAAGSVPGAAAPAVIELSELGADLLDWGSERVRPALDTVRSADLVICASPTFKATYTGLLKLFLDLLPTGEGLRDTVVVPLMLGAGPAHALAPEVFLKPVLVELGAVAPAPGLYLNDSSYTTDGRIDEYVERWGSVLVGSGTGGPE